MYKRALVPLDGSPAAETILPFILDIAGPLDMEVVLCRVVQPSPSVVIEGSRQVVLDLDVSDAEEYLAPVAVGLRRRGVRVDATVRRGTPAVEIPVFLLRATDAQVARPPAHEPSATGLPRSGGSS